MNFFNNFATALYKPGKYNTILKADKGFSIIYAFILLLISSVIIVFSMFKFYGTAEEYYKDVVPDFKFENNELIMSEPFKLEVFGLLIAANSDKEFSAEDFGNNPQGILLDRNSMIIRSVGKEVSSDYKDLGLESGLTFTKQDTYMLKHKALNIFFIFTAFSVLLRIIGFFISILLLAVIALIPNRLAGLTFGELFRIALFSKGLPLLLSIILSQFIGTMPIVISFVLSCIIINIALSSIIRSKIC